MQTIEELKGKYKTLKEVATILNTTPEQVPEVIRKLKREIMEFENEMKKLKSSL